MKKGFIFLGLVSATIAYSQNNKPVVGKVGINTESPTETLHVEGTLRVKDLPAQNEKIYTMPDGAASATKNQTFSPTKMVVVDANGVLGKADIPTGGAANGSGGANNATGGETYSGSTSIKLKGNSFERAALTGDVTADQNSNATTVVAIQGKAISNTAPTDKQTLQWNEKAQKWIPTMPEGSYDLLLIMKNIDTTLETANQPHSIPNLMKIVDVYQKYNDTNNTFQVEKSGSYEVIMSVSVAPNTTDTPMTYSLGIWDEGASKWMSRGTNFQINDAGNSYIPSAYTFISIANLKKGTDYSFKIASTQDFSLRGYANQNEEENGYSEDDFPPSTFFSIKLITEEQSE